MNVAEYVQQLAQSGVQLWLEEGKLRYRGPQAALTAPMLAELKAHKPQLLGYLSESQGRGGLEHALSYSQRSLWIISQQAPESPAYNVTLAVELKPDVDVVALRWALRQLVERHPSLRTVYAQRDRGPVQRVLPSLEVPLTVHETEGMDDAARTAWVRAEADRPFDLTRGCLRTLLLIRREGAALDHTLLLVAHHIAADFRSIQLLVDELCQLYRAARTGERVALPGIALTYLDHTSWEAAQLQGAAGERAWGYWKEELSGQLPALNLPTERRRPPVQSLRGATQAMGVDDELSHAIRALARSERTTPNVVCLAAFVALLHRYTGEETLLLGMPTAGRNQPGSENVVGHFVNTVVVRSEVEGQRPFRELLGQLQQTVLRALEHQDFPFPALVERLNPPRDASRSPLFQVLYNWTSVQGNTRTEQRNAVHQALLRDVVYSSTSGGTGATHDLLLTVNDQGTRFRFEWVYSTDLFDAQAIERLHGHYQRLLRGALANPGTQVSSLPLLDERELHHLLVEVNRTAAPFLSERCMHQHFEDQVARTPGAVAVVFGEERLTYEALNTRANRLARELRRMGVGRDSVVGVCLPRSLDLMVGLFAVHKAGGAYLPLDPGHPPERLAFMLEDAGAPVLLTHGALAPRLRETTARTLHLDDPAHATRWAGEADTNLDPLNDAGDLAYVIYTSGSTGTPKGVMVTHRNVSSLFTALDALLPAQPPGVWLAIVGIGFDVSVPELFWTLARGFRVILHPGLDSDAAQGAPLGELMQAHGVTHFSCTPTHARAFVDDPRNHAALSALQVMIVAGEALPPVLADQLARTVGGQVINGYGPTEATVYALTHPVRSGEQVVPIGRPLVNTSVYVLDRELQPVPLGVPGELFIGGAGVARGYLKRPELTTERFVPDTFTDRPGERMYRTGDLVRLRSDGAFEFLGRLDHQVKIRGQRVELGEIEASLAKQPGVRESVVMARMEGSSARLVAYVVPDASMSQALLREAGAAGEETSLWTKALRAALQQRLPAVMVPAAFVVLPSLPLNKNGKVDRKLLPAPSEPRAAGGRLPRNDLERRLAEIWTSVLGAQNFSVDSNFFEVGGDSLLALQLSQRALAAGLPLSPRMLFEQQTLADLAVAIQARLEAPTQATRTAVALGDGERAGLSPEAWRELQTRLEVRHGAGSIRAVHPLGNLQHIFLAELGSSERSTATRRVVQYTAELKGLDEAAFRAAWQQLVVRHDVFRTCFVAHAGQSLQVELARAELPWTLEDRSTLPTAEVDRLCEQDQERERARGFAFDTAPLMRLRLVRTGEGRHRFLWTFHQALLDGWSIDRVQEELLTLYRAHRRGVPELLPDVRPFGDYLRWLPTTQGAGQEAQSFWAKSLRGLTAFTPLPLGMPVPAEPDGYVSGATRRQLADGTLSATLERLARREQVTLAVVLQAAWALLLAREARQTDVLFSTVVSGRPPELSGIESMVGSLFQVLPVRVRLEPQESVGVWLRRLTREAAERQEFEFTSPLAIQRWSELPANTHYGESTLFVFQKFSEPAPGQGDELELATWKHHQPGGSTLHLTLIPRDGLSVYVRYDRRAYSEDQINLVLEKYLTTLRDLPGAADQPIASLLPGTR